MSEQLAYSSNSIFWVETDKIKPNPFQPRKEFNEERLKDLSESIRQYGVLQPLTVTRKEVEKPDGGIAVEYELIAGERRLRASKLAGVQQVPVLIRVGEDSDKTKLELAIIENIQREDLNVIDRARAFARLTEEFGFKHFEVARKVGKSREYVSNSIRILALPEVILESLSRGEIMEGHTRPILMLCDRPEEQMTLFKEIVYKKMTVRDSEKIARKIAYDKVRTKIYRIDPEIIDMEERLTEKLGTRVQIDRKDVNGQICGQIKIDFFSPEDLRNLMKIVNSGRLSEINASEKCGDILPLKVEESEIAKEEEPEEDLYSVSNFSI